MERSIEFSRRGDVAFDRLAAALPGSQRWRLAVSRRLDAGDFAAIKRETLRYVSACLGERGERDELEVLAMLDAARGRIANHTAAGLLVPLREHTLEFNLLHRQVAAAVAGLHLDDHIDVIDSTIGVRLVYGQLDPARAAAPYSSTRVHTDVWAGVPPDAVVVVLPILGDIENITIEFGEMPRERELAMMRVLPSYAAAGAVDVAHRYDDLRLEHGSIYLSDARLLHQTVRRRNSGVRLSIDFRFRTRDLEYRALVPSAMGPDSMDGAIPLSQWLAIGTSVLVLAEGAALSSSAPVSRGRLLPL